MVVYTLEQSWEVGLRSNYRRIIFSDEAHFSLGGYKQAKFVAFGALKTRTHTLKSRRTQNKSLFGADFGPEA